MIEAHPLARHEERRCQISRECVVGASLPAFSSRFARRISAPGAASRTQPTTLDLSPTRAQHGVRGYADLCLYDLLPSCSPLRSGRAKARRHSPHNVRKRSLTCRAPDLADRPFGAQGFGVLLLPQNCSSDEVIQQFRAAPPRPHIPALGKPPERPRKSPHTHPPNHLDHTLRGPARRRVQYRPALDLRHVSNQSFSVVVVLDPPSE